MHAKLGATAEDMVWPVEADERAELAQAVFHAHPAHPNAESIHGEAGDGSLERVDIAYADVNVIGSHGRGGATRRMRGRVAEHVWRAKRAVLVVPTSKS
ncbi:MAG: universal stress protein [Polyangiales bacterium]